MEEKMKIGKIRSCKCYRFGYEDMENLRERRLEKGKFMEN